MLASQPAVILWIESLLLVALFGDLDYFTGIEINFSVFYLVPVIFSTWFLSRRAGVLISVLSTGVWAYLDILARIEYSSPVIALWNIVVRLAFFLVVMQLVHVMKEARRREAILAHTDSLTGTANGRSFSDRANLELALSRRNGSALTMAYVDLDHFKRINDTVGHTEGDRLLKVVAQALKERLRSTDLVARLGGDEFGVLLPNTDVSAAPAVLDSLLAAVSEAVDGSWDVGCTIGAVTFTHAPESVDAMVRTADALMYRGKRAGRGRIEYGVWPHEAAVLEPDREASDR
jgi:diguanylate cyclase (GGDEF)-like protein